MAGLWASPACSRRAVVAVVVSKAELMLGRDPIHNFSSSVRTDNTTISLFQPSAKVVLHLFPARTRQLILSLYSKVSRKSSGQSRQLV